MTSVLTRQAAPASPPPRGHRAVKLVVAVAALLVIGGIAWFALRDTGPSEPPAFNSACGTVMRARGSERLRVLLIGDSIMAQPSCELATILASEGAETHMHAIPGSGLLTPSVDAVQRRIDRDHALPSGRSLAGPEGQWVATNDACGGGQPLRSSDGEHLSPFGAHVFAHAIAHDLDVAMHRSRPAPVC